MAVTIYFNKGVWLDFVQFLCLTQNNSIDRMIKKKVDGLKFMINQNLKILLFCTAPDYNQALSNAILSQIFDTARNAYCKKCLLH